MTIPYLLRSPLSVFFLGLAAAACSSSPRSAPDAPPDPNPATDASIVTSSDGAGLDASREAQGEAGQGGRVTVSPASIDLGMIRHDVRSSPQIITVAATGDVSDLTVLLVGEDLAIDGGDTCGRTLAAGTSCVVAFTFLSSTRGAKSDRVTIVADGESTVVPVTAQVQAGPKLAVTPATASFLAAPGESSSPVTFKVGNIGDMEVGPLTVEITGDDFAAIPTGCELLVPMGTCTIPVVFTPKGGARACETATLVVTGPAPDLSTAVAPLVGNCSSGGPSLRLTSPTPDLGSVVVGTTGPSVTVTVTSSSAAPQGFLTVTSSSAEFVITNDTCGATVLSLGGACTIDVALRPSSAGSKSTLLTVTGPSGSASMMFIGTGLDSSTDASIVTPPDDAGLDRGNVNAIDSPGLDAGSESQGEAGPAG